MHEFKYRGKDLYCEEVKLEDLARRFSTPLYVYSYHTLIDHYLKLKTAFRSIKPLICYSVKANSNLAILRSLVDKGSGLDIVSGGELKRAIEVGCPPRKIVYASVGKTNKEIEEAIRRKILFFNIESISELENINRISKRLNKVSGVCLRINPDVEPKTHRYITTGKITDKFGIDFKSAYQILLLRKALTNVKISGLHIHIGSQITDSAPYVAAVSKIVDFIGRLKKRGINLQYLNIGGGLGIIYDRETPQTAEIFAAKIMPILKGMRLKIIMEPGRFIVGNAGILLTKVLYIKAQARKKFIIVDAAMNDLIRPALYQAFHQILPTRTENRPVPSEGLRLRTGQVEGESMVRERLPSALSEVEVPRTEKVDVVGPICESADFFAKDRRLPIIKEGDYLSIMGAGAYGFSMSSNYNTRLRCQEVMVVKDKVFVIRKRETYADLIRNEIIPSFLLVPCQLNKGAI